MPGSTLGFRRADVFPRRRRRQRLNCQWQPVWVSGSVIASLISRLEAWTGSWTEPPVQTVQSGPSAARLRGIRAGSVPGAPSRSSHNPQVLLDGVDLAVTNG